MNPFILPEQQYGTPLESLLERRERVAKSEGANYGATKMFPALAEKIFAELGNQEGRDRRILEIDAGAGLFTKQLLAAGYQVTALEPAPLLHKILAEPDIEGLDVHLGFVEDQYFPEPDDLAYFDSAVVSFPARRGRGILALICELLPLAQNKVILVLPDDGSVDWSSTMRAISLKGYHARAEFIVDTPAIVQAQKSGQLDLSQIKRAMLMIIDTAPIIDTPLCSSQIINAWGAAIRVIEVPYPVPRGAATRLIRYFKAGGDRSILIKTEPEGMHHMYGNLRTAVHRIARDQISVRRVDNGIQLMQIIQSEIAHPASED
ncbi:MAG: hypothetical protein FWE46_03805 [Coriobacteriia bacterium]|nr:hypothetical protein [Coriobacteriia bacterium]MCL2537401.1 hypothetical protein [Coriobacteriia bacterium]